MKNKIDFWVKVTAIILIAFISLLVVIAQPIIILKGDKEIELNYNEEYVEPGYTALFILKDKTKDVKITNNIDNTKVGSYEVAYTITIGKFKLVEKRIVNIVDKEKPIIELIGNSYACPNKEYNEEGYVATDNYDGDITDKVVVIKGEKEIIYTVKDSSDNKTSVTRNIEYKDIEKPTIKLNGDETITINTNGTFNDPGVEVNDNCDENLQVSTSGTVNTSVAGTYQLTYTVSDASGNIESITRTVKVVDPLRDGAGKVIYLTFDDGPGAYTEQILNTLDKYGAKATFFVTNQFPAYAHLISEEARRGHAVAVHTYTHSYDVVYQSVDAYINDFNRMNEIIKERTGNYSNIFRFPGGSSNTVHCSRNPGVVSAIANEMHNRGYEYFDWNLSSGDAGGYPTSTSVYNTVVNGVSHCSNCVVLMHDIKSATANALDSMLANLSSRGYTFATLSKNSPTTHHSFGICR